MISTNKLATLTKTIAMLTLVSCTASYSFTGASIPIQAKKDEQVEVKVGDQVLYGKYSGTEITIDNNKYLLMNQSDVLFIM